MAIVLITGAASGIGRAAARRFAVDGWRCELVDRDLGKLAQVAAELPGEHGVHGIDLTDPVRVRRLADLPGPVDAVINNAGMSDASGIPLVEQDPQAQAQARLIALNLAAPAAIVSVLDRVLAVGARIVNVSSGAGLRAIPFRGYYSATKAGLIAQSAALARARPDLVVTVLCPGFVRTELVEGLIAAGRLDPRQAVAKTPLGRMAEPAEMADTMRFLASAEAAVIAGQVLSLCGGSSVYGGSRAQGPSDRPVRPLTSPLALAIAGDPADAWSALAEAADAPGAADAGATYSGVVDVGPLSSAGRSGGRVAAVHDAVRRFASIHAHDASLTLLLPADPTTDAPAAAWQDAGDAAAARMLVATFACELASRALRVNAIEVAPGLDPQRLRPVLHHVAGARTQFLTGQTLRTRVR